MSKKIAEGMDALVLDVKTGRGAFMETEERAVMLAKTLIEVGKTFGKKTIAFLTDMSQPLGFAIGNWLEVKECLDCLRGAEVPGLSELSVVLGGAMLLLGGKAHSIEEGIVLCRGALADGRAWKKFLDLVAAQGGDISYLDRPGKYPAGRCVHRVTAAASGTISAIDAQELGFVAILLGAGRVRLGEAIDPAAGIVLRKKVGDRVTAGEPVAELTTNREQSVAEAARRITGAFGVVGGAVHVPPLIKARIDDSGVHPWKI